MVRNSVVEFQEVVWDYYHEHSRVLPWRNPETDGAFDPYKVLVSEIMLQQTQANRVIPKYHQFLKLFPDIATLSHASLSAVLATWSGLGYNRRAKFLWQAAHMIMQEHDGIFPGTSESLLTLPGVGTNTAGAIMAYAYNRPVVYIETNIRTVFIHHFFNDTAGVSDSDIVPLAEQALDFEHPREWYWALMDYGVYVKTTFGNASRNSKHYTKQSIFSGSKRQIRGQVIKLLILGPRSSQNLASTIADVRLPTVLDELVRENLIYQKAGRYSL